MATQRRPPASGKSSVASTTSEADYEFEQKYLQGISNPDFQRNDFVEKMIRFQDWMIFDIPPGPRFLPMRLYVNGHKGGMPILLMSMMIYFNNWSTGAWMYFVLHGTYGVFWLSKDQIFPDPAITGDCTLMSFLMPFPIALLPYSYFGYLMMSGMADQNPSVERCVVALLVYIFGIMTMMVADAQKYFVLRERKGLITHGMNKYTRNPNYLGEIMLYASFAILLNRWEPWLVLSYMWGFIFVFRMTCKDYFLSKKAGWKEYTQRSWILLPKIYGSAPLSILFYGVLTATFYQIYVNGGMQASAMLLRKFLTSH